MALVSSPWSAFVFFFSLLNANASVSSASRSGSKEGGEKKGALEFDEDEITSYAYLTSARASLSFARKGRWVETPCVRYKTPTKSGE